MTEYLIEFHNNSYYVAEITHRGTVSGSVKVVIPYNGTNRYFKEYYTIGRTFWTLLTDSRDISKRFIVTKEINPEYFI